MRGGGELGSEEIKRKGKRTHRYGQQCGDCRGRAGGEVEEGIKWINGNEKNTIKNKLLKKAILVSPVPACLDHTSARIFSSSLLPRREQQVQTPLPVCLDLPLFELL